MILRENPSRRLLRITIERWKLLRISRVYAMSKDHLFSMNLTDFLCFIFSTKTYHNMRLMLLGSEQTGKTSLLQAFRRESLNTNHPQPPPRRVCTQTNISLVHH